jgi:hypothetical protein
MSLNPKKSHRRMTHRRENLRPTLRFSPRAWAKLLFLRDLGPTEVGGFGVSSAADLLYVDDVVLIRQDCSPVTVAFDDDDVAEYFDRQIDADRRPEQFARIWIHTHPGTSAEPSSVDEETFARVFGRSDWAVMAILARGGQSYARLQFHTGPGGSLRIPVAVDWSQPFGGTDWTTWKQEYADQVHCEGFQSHVWIDEMAAERGTLDCLTDLDQLSSLQRGTL